MQNGTSSNGLENGIRDDDERAEADQKKTYAEAVTAKSEEEERPTTTRQQAKKSSRKGERTAPMKAEHPVCQNPSRHHFITNIHEHEKKVNVRLREFAPAARMSHVAEITQPSLHLLSHFCNG